MNNLLPMLFNAHYGKNKWKFIYEVITLSIIMTIFLTFIMVFSFTQHTYSLAYKESSFDLTVQGFTEEQIAEIAALPFVEKIFPIRILSSDIIVDNENVSIDIYVADSFRGRDISFFSDKLMYKKDESLLLSKKTNPVVIDKQLAKKLRVNIGEKITFPFGKDTDVDFTVAGITEPLKNSTGSIPILIVWQGEQEQAFLDSFKEQPPYSLMFVKTNDREKANDYFLNEYTPKQFEKEGHLTSTEERYRYNKTLNVEREYMLEIILDKLRYTPPIVTLISILGFISFVLVLYREANKKLIVREKEYSILNALGVPKATFISYYIIESILMQIPILIIAAILVKYIIFDLLSNSYMPWYFFMPYCIGALILQMIATCINGLLLNKKMKKTQLAILLAKE